MVKYKDPCTTDIVRTMIRQFAGSTLPVLITDRDLSIVYSNPYAEKLFRTMGLADGLRMMLAPDSVEDCRRRLAVGDSFRADFSPLQASRLTLCFSPLHEEDSIVGGLVILSYDGDQFQNPAEVVTQMGSSLLSASFRQPLSEIFATLSMIGRKLEADGVRDLRDYRGLLSNINKNSYQMLRNTTNLVSRLQFSSGYQAPTTVVNFWSQTADLLEACDVVLHPTKISFYYSLPEEARQVECRFGEIALAMVNILANSYRYGRPGNEVTIIGRNLGQSVMVTMSDRGIGITQDLIDQVFSPFFSRGADGVPYSGLGLGLNVARQALYGNGGTIAVNSAPEGGTVVAFTLPTTNKPADPRLPFECGSSAYLRDRFSPVYVGLCDIVAPPEQ